MGVVCVIGIGSGDGGVSGVVLEEGVEEDWETVLVLTRGCGTISPVGIFVVGSMGRWSGVWIVMDVAGSGVIVAAGGGTEVGADSSENVKEGERLK